MTGSEGHLFVVHGRIESVIHDVALIPVDEAYRFNWVWRTVIGERPSKPSEWSQQGFGAIESAPEPAWAVSIGDGRGDYSVILDRIEALSAASTRSATRTPSNVARTRFHWSPSPSSGSVLGASPRIAAPCCACSSSG
jgi:hypothetical protein